MSESSSCALRTLAIEVSTPLQVVVPKVVGIAGGPLKRTLPLGLDQITE